MAARDISNLSTWPKRVTCTGRLFMCLGQEDTADLRGALRSSEGDEKLMASIGEAIARKPRGHGLKVDSRATNVAVLRHMSMTSGWAKLPVAEDSRYWPQSRAS